ncbi:hypothetical protein SAMN05518672_113114 [Chitinophaga sp. CF118]|uniref:hypothetical protein n=1 Tax=Chitinophaga sp. CF118 TaxID=1884367 RepID=UPI0008E90933|nr:hypothetical protein [Chitinophaga sp. CF118]SFE97659.1 hypothetical protein SAMN05518672_113114 [Chitinophaga sp. CF118]
MTSLAYKRLKEALINQGKLVGSSPEEATRFINDMGIRHIVRPNVSISPREAKAAKNATGK